MSRPAGPVGTPPAALPTLALGGLWEVAERDYDPWLARGNAIPGKRDTILDLVWDSLGALAARTLALAVARD